MRWYLIAAVLLGGCYDDPIQISPYELTTASEELERRQRERDEPIQSAVATARLTRVSSVMTGTESTTTSARIIASSARVEVPRARPVVDAVAGSRRFDRDGARAWCWRRFNPSGCPAVTRSSPTVRSQRMSGASTRSMGPRSRAARRSSLMTRRKIARG